MIRETFREQRITVWLVVVMTVWMLSCARSPEAKSARFMAAGTELMAKKDAARAILQFRNAAQATPKNAEAYYQLGMALIAAGDLRKGVASLRKAVELDSRHAGAQRQLARLMATSDSPELLKDAQAKLETLLQNSPEDADTLHTLAMTELKLGESGDAMEHLRRAIAAAPQEVAAVVTMAEVKLRNNDITGAEDILKKASEQAPQVSDFMVVLGRLYAAQNRNAEAERQFQQALALHPKDEAALLNMATLQMKLGRDSDAERSFRVLAGVSKTQFKDIHATFLFQKGRRDEAIREFEALSKQDPEDRLARVRWLTALTTAGRLAEARKVVDGVLKKNPKDMEGLLQRGELLVNAGMYAEAEADLTQVRREKPDSPSVHYAIARLHRARGATLLKRQELNEVLRLNPLILPARLELASDLLGDKQAKAALGVLDSAPEAQKKQIAYIQQRNWALISSGNGAALQTTLPPALAVARTPDLLMQDALVKFSTKRYSEAIQALHEALAKAPEDVRVLRLLVSMYAAQNLLPAGLQEAHEQAARYPDSPDIHYFLGNLLLESGRPDEARQAFAAAKAARPGYTPAGLALARIDLVQAKWDSARQGLDAILSSKDENPRARLWLGMLEEANGNHAAAAVAFRRATELDPGNALAWNNLAYLLADGGSQIDDALKYAQKALELAPDNPDVQDTLGWVLYRKGLYDAAVTHFQSAISKGGGIRQQYHLAMAYLKAGKQEQGRALLQVALRKDPTPPEAKQAQQLYQSVKP